MITKKRKIAIGCALGICALSGSLIIGLTGCGGTSKWDVSKNASSNVKAELIKIGDDYRLNISGSGDMTDYKAASDAPWYHKAEKIKEVNISNGIKYIGSYAFAGIENVEYIMLPSGVTSVGTNFAGDTVKIFAVTENVDYGTETSYNVYVYKDEIQTNDKFWQSDKSSGNIISDQDDLFVDEGKFWHYNKDDEATVYVKTKVLFIGNSFTYRNGIVEYSSGVPGIFDNIAEDLGFAVETYSITGPGWYLDNHAKSTDVCGKQVDLILNARDDFDYVVLQDQSTVAFENYSRFVNGIKALQTKINATQSHAQIYLYETWGSPFSANERKITVPEMEAKLRDAYTKAGEECGVNVSYIGKAFTNVYNSVKSINLYATDNRHQGYPGAYLSACVHVGNMLGGDVRNTNFIGEEKYSAPNLDEPTLTALRTAAYNVVFGNDDDPIPVPPSDNPSSEDAEQEQILKIACWGRFMKEAKFNELMNDFKKYCTDNNVAYKEIIGTYYEGATNSSPYYYIADFTAKVYQDGDPDIVLPCADNFNANQSTLAAVDLIAIDVYGQTNRRVAALNSDDLTKEFFKYIQTASAKAILEKQD